ncbi:MAG: type II toxin-antitoxin system RelE/ParE family toxin [Erysipelotrichaceae bacterium]
MINIHISPKAISDMTEIKDYISEELSNRSAAIKLLKDIYSQIAHLQNFPLVGTPLFSKLEVENNYRFLVVKNYMVFYRFEVDSVYVIRILYGKSNYMKILFE